MKHSFLFVLATLAATTVHAQNLNIAYVDLPTAEAQVQALKDSNDVLSREIDGFKKQQGDLQASLVVTRNGLVEIQPVIQTLKDKNVELFSIMSGLADRGLKADAEKALARNKEILVRLESRKEELEKAQVRDRASLSAIPPMIQTNEAKIQSNLDNIVLINAAIAKTRNQQAGLQASLDGADSLQAEAAKILK